MKVGASLLKAIALLVAITSPSVVFPQDLTQSSPLTPVHLSQIDQLFKVNRIPNGSVGLDTRGRIELQGEYENERQVDLAFSLAQTVVGVRWVSPVTPQNIKVKAWEECLSRLLSGEQCGPTSVQRSAPAAEPEKSPPGPVVNKYALVVGIGRFKNRIESLQYANKDALDIYAYLVDSAGGHFKRQDVVLLRDERATRENVVHALDEIQRRAQPNDLVLLYFSSHGTPPDKFGGVHVVTFDSEVKPRERIWETSLTEGMLRDFIQKVKAKRLIVIMDACYSNGAYAQIAGFLPPGGKSLDAGWDEGNGRSRRYMAERFLGAKDLIVEEPVGAFSPTHSNTLPQGWGKVLISASDAGERSWESDQLRNSVFTRYFVDGLRNNRGAIKEAFDQAKPLVRQQVKREKGADIEQTPQLMPNRRDWNMSLAVTSH